MFDTFAQEDESFTNKYGSTGLGLSISKSIVELMDGLEATRIIRAMDREDAKNIPIIALTANAFDEDVRGSLQAGMNAHLSKPIQPDVLYKTLEEML